MSKVIDDFYEYLREGRCHPCKFAKYVGTWAGWGFLGCYHHPYTGKWVREIKNCPKHETKMKGEEKVLEEILEEEPCEDVVSRQAVLDKAYTYGNGLEPEGYCVEVEDIQALPPVIPTHKKGKWINRRSCQVDENTYDVATCSECDEEITIDPVHDNYCPNCGVKMKNGE